MGIHRSGVVHLVDSESDTDTSSKRALQTEISLRPLVLLGVLKYSAGPGLEKLSHATVLYNFLTICYSTGNDVLGSSSK